MEAVARRETVLKILWTEQEDETLGELKSRGMTWRSIGARLGRSGYACFNRWRRLQSPLKPRYIIPTEHRGWYEKLRRNHSLALARAELERVLAS